MWKIEASTDSANGHGHVLAQCDGHAAAVPDADTVIVARLRELREQTGAQVEVYFYEMLPTWRVLALDNVQFVSAFGEDHEGHTSPMYKIAASAHGALHRGFRRFTASYGCSPGR